MTNIEFVKQRGIDVKRNQMPQYDSFYKFSKPGFIIPGLHEDLVPQGFAYLERKNWLFVSYYCDRDDCSSVIAVIDAKTNILIKALRLNNVDKSPYTEHAGGVAVNDNYLWVSSSSTLYYMSMEKVICSDHNEEVSFDGTIPIDVNGSFVKIKNNILWVGEFAHSTNYTTKESHHTKSRTSVKYKGWITGYELDPKTAFIPDHTPRTEDDIPVPDYILSIPYRIQGMAIMDNYIILSESYGRTADSHLLIFNNPLLNTVHQYVSFDDYEVPLWYLDDLNQRDTIVTPPMAESIVQYQNALYVLFESGANKYRDDGSFPLDRAQLLSLTDKFNQ